MKRLLSKSLKLILLTTLALQASSTVFAMEQNSRFDVYLEQPFATYMKIHTANTLPELHSIQVRAAITKGNAAELKQLLDTGIDLTLPFEFPFQYYYTPLHFAISYAMQVKKVPDKFLNDFLNVASKPGVIVTRESLLNSLVECINFLVTHYKSKGIEIPEDLMQELKDLEIEMPQASAPAEEQVDTEAPQIQPVSKVAASTYTSSSKLNSDEDDVSVLAYGEPEKKRQKSDTVTQKPTTTTSQADIKFALLIAQIIQLSEKFKKTGTKLYMHPYLKNAAKNAANGLTLLHIIIARTAPNLEIIKEILENFPEMINAQDNDGWTPLHYLAAAYTTTEVKEQWYASKIFPMKKSLEIMIMLLNAGANANITDNDGKYAVDYIFNKKQSLKSQLLKIAMESNSREQFLKAAMNNPDLRKQIEELKTQGLISENPLSAINATEAPAAFIRIDAANAK